MLSLTDSFIALRLSENFAPPNLSDYLRASAAASIFFFPASCLAMSLQVQPAGGLNTRVTLCLFGLCASRINPAHFRVLVGLSGLEPPTSRLSGVRSNQLSYKPISSGQRLRLLSSFTFSPLVEMSGIEPLTPCLQGRCSPS